MAAISVTVNGERQDLDQEYDLNGLLLHFSLPDKRIAVELNGRVIRRSEWPETTISEGDNIEVVHFVGGG